MFDGDQTEIIEEIASDLKGSPVDHQQFFKDTSKYKTFAYTLVNSSTQLVLNESLDGYYMKHWDEWLWSVDELKAITPDINWDKIFMGVLGRSNIKEKILINIKFIKNLNNIIKQMDKRLVFLYTINTLCCKKI